jgi:hypothetical protein
MLDSYLIEAGLAKTSGDATKLLSKYQPNFDSVLTSPSAHINDIWARMSADGPVSNNLRGSVFELLIGSILVANGIKPFFTQAEVTYVNNARFDVLLWEDGWNPISLSIKTSLRERYKQAELEAWALNSVHRKSENWLITLSEEEVLRRKRQLGAAKEYSYLRGLVLASSAEFDEFILYLKGKTFDVPKDVNPMANNKVVKT